MTEKNILKAIKEMGYTQAEALELLKANQKSELLTNEEIEEQEKEAQAKAKAKAEKKKKKDKEEEQDEEEEPAPPTPSEPEIVVKKLEAIDKRLEKIEKSGRIPGKTPSEGEQRDKEEMPDSTRFIAQRNMFETDI